MGDVGLYLCEAFGDVGDAIAGEVGLHRGEAGELGEAGEKEGLVGLNLGEAGENVGLDAIQFGEVGRPYIGDVGEKRGEEGEKFGDDGLRCRAGEVGE